MKKNQNLLATAVLTLTLCGIIYTKYIKGFIVVNTILHLLFPIKLRIAMSL